MALPSRQVAATVERTRIKPLLIVRTRKTPTRRHDEKHPQIPCTDDEKRPPVAMGLGDRRSISLRPPWRSPQRRITNSAVAAVRGIDDPSSPKV
jgi:hypothetical protein